MRNITDFDLYFTWAYEVAIYVSKWVRDQSEWNSSYALEKRSPWIYWMKTALISRGFKSFHTKYLREKRVKRVKKLYKKY